MRLALRALVSLGILGLLLRFIPWGEIREALGRLSFAVWVTVLAGFLLGHLLGVVKWRLVVNLGRGELKVLDATRCYAAGLFANMCLPSIVGGDVLRAGLAVRATGRPEAVVLGSVADRMLDVAALALLVGGGGVAVGSVAPEWRWHVLTVAGLGGFGALLLVLLLVMRPPLDRLPRRFRRRIARSLVALRRLWRQRHLAAAAFGLAVSIQTGFVLLNVWIGRSIGIEVPVAVWFLVWPLAKIAGLLPVSLGGLGVRDATFGALLASVGVPVATGVVASLIWQSVLLGGGLTAALWWWGSGRLGRWVAVGSEGRKESPA
jgi:uncharacterized membrane protein YbhN (UPF0104 family)